MNSPLIPVIFALCDARDPFLIGKLVDEKPQWLRSLDLNDEFGFGSPRWVHLEDHWYHLEKLVSSDKKAIMIPVYQAGPSSVQRLSEFLGTRRTEKITPVYFMIDRKMPAVPRLPEHMGILRFDKAIGCVRFARNINPELWLISILNEEGQYIDRQVPSPVVIDVLDIMEELTISSMSAS